MSATSPCPLAAGNVLGNLFGLFLARVAGDRAAARVVVELDEGRDADLVAVVEAVVVGTDQADVGVGFGGGDHAAHDRRKSIAWPAAGAGRWRYAGRKGLVKRLPAAYPVRHARPLPET